MADQQEHAITVTELTKKFGDLTAVNGISFSVDHGEIFGFLGPNGAGKSTTISMLITIEAPTAGDAIVNSYRISSQRDEVRRSIGVVFQDPSLDDHLSGEENLYFHAMLYGVPTKEYRERLKQVLDLVGLWDRRKEIIKTYSGGMRRRLEIARGLVHHPSILFLDEPTVGLDPQTRANIWQYVIRLKKEHAMTIFLTTHYMDEAEYCDRIAVMDHGNIIAQGTPNELKSMIGGDVITIHTAQRDALAAELKEKFDVTPQQEDGTLTIKIKDGGSFMPKLFNSIATPIDHIELRRPTLDDVFLHLTGTRIREEQGSATDMMRMRHMRQPR